MSDQIGAAGKTVAGVAETAAIQVREQAEALRASIAQSEKFNAAAETARQQAKRVGKEAKRAGAVAAAQAPVVAAAALEKGSHALEVARDRGTPVLQDALLSAFDTEAGKKLAHTSAGAALKSKLPARKRRWRKLLLLLVIPAAGGAAFKASQAKRSGGTPSTDPYGDAPVASTAASTPPPVTVEPNTVGTASGDPLGGLIEKSVESGPEVEGQTEPPATSAGEDGELHTNG